MKISCQWLKDYVNFNIPPEKLAHRLTMAGMEVEKIHVVQDDAVLEMEITPNRPDCLNILGISREIAAVLGRTLKLPKYRKAKTPRQKCPVEILDRHGCSRYVGTVICDVRVSASPEGIKKRLETVDVRSINNVVDITNFCLMETGQPMHAFDYDKLIGEKIVVRRARAGEKITTIDGVQRTLDPGILVIADAQKPVAIAGIIGGKDTEVTEGTKNILLESAYFDPVIVRRGCRALGVSTDSSYRFERGVDILAVADAAHRAVALILQNAGGKVTARTDLFSGKRKIAPQRIRISVSQINKTLGAQITMSQSKTILKKLGFKVTVGKDKGLEVIPPSFRGDIKREEDLIEEVARILGYDHLPSSLPEIKASAIPENGRRRFNETLRGVLIGQGFSETVLYSLINQGNLDKCLLNSLTGVRIQNPLSQEQEMLRPAVLPSFMPVVRLNFNRGQKDLKLFEAGKIYSPSGERDVLSLIMSGTRYQDWRLNRKDRMDFYDMKGALEALMEKLELTSCRIEPQTNAIFEQGHGACFKSGEETLGFFGKLHGQILKNWDIKPEAVYFAQLDLELVSRLVTPKKPYCAPTEYPAVTRDVSLAVKKTIPFDHIRTVARANGGDLLSEINFIEQYLGEKIPQDCRGLVFSLVYQSSTRTLTEEGVNAVHRVICREFEEKLGAVIR